MADPGDFYIILGALSFSAFFSGVEIAFISSDKLQIEVQAKNGRLVSRILSGFINNQSRFLATTLIGNNIALVVYGIFMAKLLFPLLEQWLPLYINSQGVLMIVETIISTIIVLVTAEFLPKSLFIINPNGMLNLMAIPMKVLYYLLYLPTIIIVSMSRHLIKNVLQLEYTDAKPVYGLIDLNNYIKSLTKQDISEGQPGSQVVDVDEKIFSNALEFKTVKVRECMIPRTEIVAIDMLEDGIEELKQAHIDSGHSKIIVYKETIDDIVGFCHALELFKKPASIEKIMNPILLVPETMSAKDLMVQFIAEGKSIAAVIDEYGGTSGLVSIEDIIEEIIGEIEDEHDTDELLEEKIDDGTYHLSARQEIDYLNEKYGWDLPEGEYETLGGLILAIAEDIPQVNSVVNYTKYQFKILSIQDNRINTVEIKIQQAVR
jgi:CBS domain containing-hemolysin-like protein